MVNGQLRDTKFSTNNLVIDPLQGAVVTRNVEDFLGQVSRDLREGRYSPRPGFVLRSAKKLGITRPVCALHPRDALVFRAIVHLAEAELLRGTPSWVGFQRQDKGPDSADDSQSIDWWERWMRHEGMLPNLLERDDIQLIVQSDISNFFPSVRLEVIREHLANNTSLDATLVRLCCQIIASVHPRLDYADDAFLGLPQEIHGASRTIAQAILKPVDDAFAERGTDGRYSRFMDDVIWGATTLQEASEILAEFQAQLEPLGLYPNASKTRIQTKEEFLTSFMVATNAELDEFEKEIEPLFHAGA